MRYEAGRMVSALRYEAGLTADEAPLCGMKRSFLLRQGYGGHATAHAMTWREITGFRVLPMRPMRPIGPIVRGGQPETQDHFSVCSFAKNHRRCYIIILSLNWI